MSAGWVISDSPTPVAAANTGWEVSDSPTPSASVPAGTPGGVLPGVPGAPTPAGMTGPTAPTVTSSLGDIGSTVASHAKNLVAGPANAITAPPQGTAEKVAQAVGPGGLPLYRTAIEPSIAPARRAFQQALQGKYSDAARSAESAIPVVGPWADQVEKDVQDKGAGAGLAGLATDVIAPKVAGAGVAAAGDAMDSTAGALINRTVGARKADFARGANPGRGYLDNDLGPSGSMESIADKAGEARTEVGKALGDAYTEADKAGKLIPADTVRKAIHPIIDTAKGKSTGPGVMADPEVYDTLKNSFEPALQAADAKGGFTPSELWKIRKDMNESLNWGDQSRLNLTKTQQRVSGALGGVLEDSVPGVEELNQNYQDLSKLHGRALERSNTHSTPLTGMAVKAAMTGAGALAGAATHSPILSGAGALAGAALDSIPVKTAVATGLHGAASVAPVAPAAAIPATLAGGALSGPPTVSAEGGSTGNGEPQNPNSDNSPLGKGGGADQKDQSATSDNDEVSHQAESTTPASPEQSIPNGVAPESHDFSVSQWVRSNPGGDVDEAMQAAEKLGFEVVK